MITSLFIRHFKIYKGINFIPISEGCGFSSLIGENGVGKSSILEALDYVFNRKTNSDWPINNDAKSEGGINGSNIPFISPVFLIKKELLNKTKKEDFENYEKALKLSNFLWNTNIKTKSHALDQFYKHREELSKNFSQEEYLLIIIGKKYNENGIYLGSFHTYIDFVLDNPVIKPSEAELQNYFKGFYDYIISNYSYIYIPVETDVHTYTKLETQDMQKLMDKNIQNEIEKAITPGTLKQINKDLDNFVKEIEEILEIYEYKGHYKNSLTMPDLVSKIIEAYFSIKILNKKSEKKGKRIPVSELSSGEKRKALIDVAYSFLLKNSDRLSNIILGIDEPEASLHISACFSQFEKLINLSKSNHQVIVSTHWYGYLPIVSNGSATAIKKNNANEINIDYFNLYNYRETITQTKKAIKGILPIDYNIKSYNDLVQSIVISLLQDSPYNWIICEGLSEKIYFEEFFKQEVESKLLRILPVGSYKEVHKIYKYLISPTSDPDYKIVGKVICIIDTDNQRVEVDYQKSNKNLIFERFINTPAGTQLISVDNNLTSPPTEIEDALNPFLFFQTLMEFSDEYEEVRKILQNNKVENSSKNSSDFLDLRESEKKVIKSFFDDNDGYNKIRFAKKYVELTSTPFFSGIPHCDWVVKIKENIG
ncbi:ATP-dependent nuclease [Elizabethkingia anophelis]|uniref:ATP-dependent nuclease n=1 Tax=Elizabethkingia anophelis TaxID=1117645 RepID=UPI0038923C4F